MKDSFDNSLFEDQSTIHYGGDDGTAEFDYLMGFDDTAEETGAAPTEVTADGDAGTARTSTAPEGADGADKGGPEATAPTTEQDGDGDTKSDAKFTFNVKIDHKDQEVSVTEADLPSLYQRAANMDRANQRAQTAQNEAERYRGIVERIASAARALDFQGDTQDAVIESMLSGVMTSARDSKIEAMVNGGTAKEVAEFIVDQKMKTAETEPVQLAEPEHAAPSVEQFSADLQELMNRRPELRGMSEFPEEVLSAYAEGENLTVAYLDYESKQNAAARQNLEKQNRIFRENQESASRAPVRGVAGSGGTESKEDMWLIGFNDDYW